MSTLVAKPKLYCIKLVDVYNRPAKGVLYAVTDSWLVVCDQDHQAMTGLVQGRVPALTTIAVAQILKVRIHPLGSFAAGTIGWGVMGFFVLCRWQVNESSPVKGDVLLLNASIGVLFVLLGFVGSLINIRRFRIDKSQEQFLIRKSLPESYAAQQLMLDGKLPNPPTVLP